MAKVVRENNTSFRTSKPQSIDTGQLEYTVTSMLTYGGLTFILLTLSVTYVYLLVQKVKN